MSLINEALKKAQRQRNEEPGETAPAAPAGGTRITKRGKATSANTMVLIGSGALVLVVLSVVVTVYLLNRPTPTATSAKSPVTSATPALPAAASAGTPAPIVVAPIAPTSTPAVQTDAASTVAASTSPVSAAPAPIPLTSGATIATTPAPVEATPVAAAPKIASVQPDERISAFVEAIRVTGIRSSGNESRALMNERVYRVNDLVDRNLNLRLIKVAADSLTFADGNGVMYVKNF